MKRALQPPHVLRHRAAAALSAIAIISCRGEERQDASTVWAESDSAGTVVVRQTLDITREIELTEVWRIGSLEGDESTQFYNPRDGAFGPDGEIYVLDSGNHRVKVFSADDGSLIRAFGSQGSGPGEFERLAGSMDLGDQKVVVMDVARRLHAFDPSGAHIATLSLLQGLQPGHYPGLFRWVGDTWLMTVSQLFNPEAGGQVDLQPSTLRVVSFPGGLGEETGLRWDAAIANEIVGEMGWIVSPIFAQRPHTYLDGQGRLYRIVGDEYGWEVYAREGVLERRVMNDADRLPVLQEDLDRYEQDRRNQCRDAPPQSECHAFVEDALPVQMAMTEPEFRPAVYQLDGSRRGDLLVLRADLGYDVIERFQSKTYDLFAPDGRFRGRFTRGPGFRVLALEEDRLVAIERDDLDVESVVLYLLSDPPS